MAQTEKFWDKTADKYSKSPVRNEEVYRKKLEVTRGYFKPDMDVFEFACGTGTTAISHASYVNHIVAIDVSSRMLEIARDKAKAENIENITFEHSTIEDFKAPEKAYDVAMAHSILHLLEKPDEAIIKIYDLLKPGGVFVTSTVCLGDSKVPWGIVIGVARALGFAPFVNILKRAELEAYFLKAGFEIDYQREPRKGEAAFIVLKKPG